MYIQLKINQMREKGVSFSKHGPYQCATHHCLAKQPRSPFPLNHVPAPPPPSSTLSTHHGHTTPLWPSLSPPTTTFPSLHNPRSFHLREVNDSFNKVNIIVSEIVLKDFLLKRCKTLQSGLWSRMNKMKPKVKMVPFSCEKQIKDTPTWSRFLRVFLFKGVWWFQVAHSLLTNV